MRSALIGAVVGLAVVAAAASGYYVGKGEALAPIVQKTASPDPCAVQAQAYANAGSSSNVGVIYKAANDYNDCRARHP